MAIKTDSIFITLDSKLTAAVKIVVASFIIIVERYSVQQELDNFTELVSIKITTLASHFMAFVFAINLNFGKNCYVGYEYVVWYFQYLDSEYWYLGFEMHVATYQVIITGYQVNYEITILFESH